MLTSGSPTAALVWCLVAVGIPTASSSLVNPRSTPVRRQPQPLSWPSPVPADTVPPIDWSSIPRPSFSSPPQRKTQLETTQVIDSNWSSSLKLAVSTTNQEDLDDPNTSLLPASVDWRNRTLPSVSRPLNYVTTAQHQGVCQSCWAFAVTALIESQVRIEHGLWSKRSEADIHDGAGAACESTGNTESTLAFVAGLWDEIHLGNDTSGGGGGEEQGQGHGVADWPCDPYEDTLHGYEHCADRRGRATYIPEYKALGTVEDQKRWLAGWGPIVATFVLYEDFNAFGSSGANGTGGEKRVYRWDEAAGSNGNHIALVVGYDDGVGDKGAWIVKNSWGGEWGDGGFVYFGYGEANIDGWTKYGIANVSPDPWSRKRHQSGNMMQSSNGETHRNFELLLALQNSTDVENNGTSSAPSFTHYTRDGDSLAWSIVSEVSASVDTDEAAWLSSVYGQPAIIGTSYNNRDFHAVAKGSGSSIQHWALTNNGNNSTWELASVIRAPEGDAGIDGLPGLVQTDDSTLVMVVRHSDGSLREWQRLSPSPSTPSLSWNQRSIITSPHSSDDSSGISHSGSSLVQSNIGQDLYHPQGTDTSTANLYVVAIRKDGRMQLFWRPGLGSSSRGSSTTWTAGDIFGSTYTSQETDKVDGAGPGPVMIQTFSNTANETSIGDFHLVISPAGTGSVQHWRRTNHDIHIRPPSAGEEGGGKWKLVEELVADSEVKHVWSLVQGSFDERMHMVTEQVDGRFAYWERDPDGEEGMRWEFVEMLPI